MRTLTIGVLIVTGGTLAALPFRKYQAIPDASTAPVQVTGPKQSVLDTTALAGQTVGTAVEQIVSNELATELVTAALPSWQQTVIPQRRRQIDIPLTYEDLAAPIDQPVAIQQRFGATVSAREKQLERERVAELVMPALQNLAASQQQELQRVAETFVDKTPPTAAATLASTTSREPKIQTLPATGSPSTSPEERQRHWIRQPE